MSRLRALAVAALLLAAPAAVAVAPAAVEAAIAPQLRLDEAEQADLRRIEAYLESIRTVRARFEQSSSNGERAAGELFLSRPGRLRIDYQPPTPILVVADGALLVYYDRSLEQVSHVPLSATPAGILLDPDLSLDDPGLTVTEFERGDGELRLSLVRTETPGEGSITLVFATEPIALRQWRVIDAQGIVTTVSLIDPQFGVELDPQLFRFVDPRLQRPFPSGN